MENNNLGKDWQKAQSIILNGVSTLSKSPLCIAQGSCPAYVEKAKGAYFWDTNGKRYIDFPMALGPVILGYAYKEVDDKVRKQMKKGFLFSLSNTLEIKLAELLQEIIPCAEKIRILKTGSEAMSAAVRIARAYTGKETVAVCGYHGWHDWTAIRTTRSAGIPSCLKKKIHEFGYNDIESLKNIFEKNPGKIAAVILEPVGMYAPKDNFLQKVADLTRDNGALLIFDEVITGFRLSLGGAQEYFSITPDLSAFGKAMANGYPISALVGKKKILDKVENDVFISSTYAGDLLSITAAITTINILKKRKVNDYILNLGKKLQDGLNAGLKEFGINGSCEGLPHKTFIVFKDMPRASAGELETFFRQECLLNGAFLGYGHFVSFSHKQSDITKSIKIAYQVFSKMSNLIKQGKIKKQLKGGIATSAFKRY